jgi:hypothetical protein
VSKAMALSVKNNLTCPREPHPIPLLDQKSRICTSPKQEMQAPRLVQAGSLSIPNPSNPSTDPGNVPLVARGGPPKVGLMNDTRSGSS